MSKPFRYLVLSDLHFGHRKTKALDLATRLNRWLHAQQKTAIDAVFLAGDVFDRRLDVPSEDALQSFLWIDGLIRWCASKQCILRVLEGTPSHDWKQSKLFETLAQILKLPVDVRYIDTLSLEYLAEHDKWILYCPDEWRPTTQETYLETLELLKDHQRSQVDLAIMHGAFKYQYPSMLEKVAHDESSYLELVKDYIHIGHVHIHSCYDRIVAQGSFDRLAHGEEEPKGGVYAISGDTRVFHFLENPEANIYRTIELTDESVEIAYGRLDHELSRLPEQVHVRLKADHDHPIWSAYTDLTMRWPRVNWTKLTTRVTAPVVRSSAPPYVPMTLTRDNLMERVLEQLQIQDPSCNELDPYRSLLGPLLHENAPTHQDQF